MNLEQSITAENDIGEGYLIARMSLFRWGMWRLVYFWGGKVSSPCAVTFMQGKKGNISFLLSIPLSFKEVRQSGLRRLSRISKSPLSLLRTVCLLSFKTTFWTLLHLVPTSGLSSIGMLLDAMSGYAWRLILKRQESQMKKMKQTQTPTPQTKLGTY